MEVVNYKLLFLKQGLLMFPLSPMMSLSRLHKDKEKAGNIVESLLKGGADPDKVNEAGKTPADVCKFSTAEDLLRKASKQKR